MKKLLTAIMVICFLAMVMIGTATAAETTKTLTFQWEQTNPETVIEWKLWWSDISGGPYGTSIGTFAHDDNTNGPIFSDSNEMLVTGSPGTNVVKYFILKACGDVIQPDGSFLRECSEASNEVSYTFWIPSGSFSAPFNFIIKEE